MAKAWLVAALVVCAMCGATVADVEELAQSEVSELREEGELAGPRARAVLAQVAGQKKGAAMPGGAVVKTKEQLAEKKRQEAAKNPRKAGKKGTEKAKERKADKAGPKKSKDSKSSAEGGGLPRSDLKWKTNEQKLNEKAKAIQKAEDARKKKEAKMPTKDQEKLAAKRRKEEKLDAEEEQNNKKKKALKIPGEQRKTKRKKVREEPAEVVDPSVTKVIKQSVNLMRANNRREFNNFRRIPKPIIKKKSKKSDNAAGGEAFKRMNRAMDKAANKKGPGGCSHADCASAESRDEAPLAKDMTPEKGLQTQKGRYVKTPGQSNKAYKKVKPPNVFKKDPPKFKSSAPKPCPHEELGLEHDVEDFLLD